MEKMCVFVSYSSADRLIAEQVQQQLGAAGYDVWFDEERLEFDWSREISRALVERAEVICLLWTQSAAQSKWVQHEWLTARALEKLIIPCLFPEAPPLPLALNHLRGIVVRANDSLAAEILTRLKIGSARDVRYDFTIRSPGVQIPYSHNTAFVGRNADMAEIYQIVVGDLDKAGVSLTGVVGMGGVGKTQIVAEFALRYGFAFQSVNWIPASNPNRWFDMLVDLARTQMLLKVEAPDRPDAPIQYFEALRQHFQKNPQALLVFDNVTDPRQLASKQLVAGTPLTVLTLGCSVLFTSRRSEDLKGVHWKRIGVLPLAAAVRLLTQDREPESAAERKEAEGICSIMGLLPLALILANGFLRSRESVSYREYRLNLESNRLGTIDLSKMSKEQLATRHAAVIEKTLQDQLARLKPEAAALHLLKLSSFFPDGDLIPKELLASLGGMGLPPRTLERPFDRAIDQLRSCSIVEEVFDSTAIRLHPLLRAAITRGMTVPEEQRMKREAAQVFAEAYSDFKKLEATYLNRGIDNLLLDIATAATWGREGDRTESDLILLFRVLSQSTAILRNTETASRNVFFSQQVALRAAQFGFEDLRRKAEARSAELRGYTFALRWVRGPGMSSLVRSMVAQPSHRRQSNSVAISEDGRYIITDVGDRTLAVWHGLLGIHLYDLEVESQIREVAFVGSTYSFVVVSERDAVEIWDAEKSACVGVLSRNLGGARSVAITPDGTQAIVVCGDGAVRVWTLDPLNAPGMRQLPWFSDADRSRPVRVYCGGQGSRTTVVVVLEDRTARVGDLDASGEETIDFNTQERELTVSRRGDYAVAWSGTQSAGVWNLKSGHCEYVIKTAHPITDVAIAVDAGLMIVTEFFGDLSVVDYPLSRSPKRLLGTHGVASGAKVAVTPDGSVLASAAFGEVKVWNAAERWPNLIPPGHRSKVSALDILPDMRWFASASWDATARIWDLEHGAILRSFERHRNRIDVLSLWLDGTAITGGSLEGLVWRVEDCQVLRELGGRSVGRVRRTSQRIVTAMFSGTVLVTDPDHGTREIGRHGNQLVALALVGGGQYAVTGAGDGSIRTWNLAAFREEGGFQLHDGSITDIAALTGTDYIISGCWDGTVKLCRWQDPGDGITLKRPGCPIRAVAASSSGRRVAAADGATVRVWSVSQRLELGSCSLWDEIACLVMPQDDLVLAGDDSGNLYSLRFGLR
jgi:WD40 repeat protein